jgi:hypothetical protein
MSAGPEQIYLLRHAEKPQDGAGGPAGVDESGAPSPHSLTPRGWQRAGALAVLFRAGTDPVAGWAGVPTALVAPDYGAGPDALAHRTVQTVTPLARRLDLTVQRRRSKGQEDELAADLLAASGCVLVSWEHEHLPAIVHGIAARVAVAGLPTFLAAGWPDARFDLVLVLRRGADGTYAASVHPQLLLDGDLPTVPA